jgi:hypothetical protein
MVLAGLAFGFSANLAGIILFTFIFMFWLSKYTYFYYDLFWDKNKIVLHRPFPLQRSIEISNDFEIVPVEIISFVFKLYALKYQDRRYFVLLVSESIMDMFSSDKVAKEMELKFKKLFKNN